VFGVAWWLSTRIFRHVDVWLSESVTMTEKFGDRLDVAVYLCCSEIIGTAFKSVISNIKAAQTKIKINTATSPMAKHCCYLKMWLMMHQGWATLLNWCSMVS
jgi:hypothetical protein